MSERADPGTHAGFLEVVAWAENVDPAMSESLNWAVDEIRHLREANVRMSHQIDRLDAVVNHPIIRVCIRMNSLQFPELEAARG